MLYYTHKHNGKRAGKTVVGFSRLSAHAALPASFSRNSWFNIGLLLNLLKTIVVESSLRFSTINIKVVSIFHRDRTAARKISLGLWVSGLRFRAVGVCASRGFWYGI